MTPYLTIEQIENIAQRVLRAYARLPGKEAESQFRVCPYDLAVDLLGLKVEYYHLAGRREPLGVTADGSCSIPIYRNNGTLDFVEIDGKTILIEKNLLSRESLYGRYNFTLMHECAHQIFYMLFNKRNPEIQIRPKVGVYREGSRKRDEPPDGNEWRTDKLTSALLMPPDVIQRNLAFFGLPSHIHSLNPVFQSTDFKKFQSMAFSMGVSRKTLSYRMQNLGMLDLDESKNPYESLNIYCD